MGAGRSLGPQVGRSRNKVTVGEPAVGSPPEIGHPKGVQEG